MILTGYHGAPRAFQSYDFSKTGKNGAEHGAGAYITSSKQMARAYGKTILKIEFTVSAAFASDKITITREQVKKFIKNYVDPSGRGLLSDFNDVFYYGYNKVLNEVVESYFIYNNNDVDILSEILLYIASRSEDPARVFDAVYKVFKKDFIYYEQPQEDGEVIKNYIIFSNNQILNITED